jgi:histone H2A
MPDNNMSRSKQKSGSKTKPVSNKKRKRPKYGSFRVYVYRVLKQVHPDIGVSSKSMLIMDSCMRDVMQRLSMESVNLLRYNKTPTISSRTVQTAARLLLPGEIAKHGVSEGTKAVTKYLATKPSKPNETAPKRGKNAPKAKKAKPISKSSRAGLQFPVGRVLRMLKEMNIKNVSPQAAVYMAAVMEYIAAEILELSGNAAKDNKKSRISPRHIVLAVRLDEELSKMFVGATIAAGGVIPEIHAFLLPKKTAAQTAARIKAQKAQKNEAEKRGVILPQQ